MQLADGLKSSYGDHDGSDWSTGRLTLKLTNHNVQIGIQSKNETT